MSKPPKTPSPKAILIGQRMRTKREQLGLSQQQFADMIGVSKGAVGQYDIGYTTPRPKRFERIAEVLGVTVEWLLTGNEAEEKVRAQTTNEMAALALLRAIPHDRQASAIAMLQGLAAGLTKN
jgi:transcriptional regulator with XRE-family HTH domain